jgi:SpoVK/Ycf46/Vps4 family AAA+-type ATPase
VRRIEPERNLIVIMEDVDETIQRYGEHELLALLDGESQIANVVNVATTNYPDRLGARIVNRPSRFDERIFVDMPTPAARAVYLQKVAPQVDGATLQRWVHDTDKMSVAHLRELAAAVLCLDQNYEDVLERLRSMRVKPREISGFSNGEVGFTAQLNSGGAAQSPMMPARR